MTSSTSGTTSSTNSNLFNLYVSDVFDLAKTIVVKLDQIGQAMNNLVVQKSKAVLSAPDDRTTWKYYQNISGAYNFTDTPMFVESLDGNGTISFDKATLAANPLTLASYTYGSYYYNELVTKYPDQEMLILGILYPCDINAAIAAEDGTILSYPSYLVESTETDFIANLQDWITGYLGRWVNKPFALSDNLYVTTYFAQLVLAMVPAIMNIRLRACKTNQAHSFHIGQYLRSHGFLDFYLAELTREQTLDFYRNINYYLRNAGSAETFKTLVNLLMTKRGLPLYEYDFHHNVGAIHYVDVSDASNLLPTATFKRNPLNAPAEQVPMTDFNLTDVFALTAYSAPGNLTWQAAHKTDVEEVLDRAPKSALRTKVIESTLSPSNQALVQAPEFVVFNNWLALTMDGTYTASFQFTPPGTSVPIQLTQQDAVALWIYALAKALEPAIPPAGFVSIQEVPPIFAQHAAMHTLPTFAQLRPLITSSVPDATLTYLLSLGATAPNSITTIAAFKSFCSTVYEANQNQALLTGFQEDPSARAQLQFATERCYHDITGHLPLLTTTVTPYVGMPYIEFLANIGFSPANYSQLDYYNLTTALYEAATGSNLSSVDDPLNIQAAMIELLRLLSSYSILVVSTSSQTGVTSIAHPDVRVFDVSRQDQMFAYVEASDIQISMSGVQDFETFLYDWNVQFPPAPIHYNPTLTATIKIDPSTKDSVNFNPSQPYFLNVGVGITTDFDPQASFAALTDAQRATIAANRS